MEIMAEKAWVKPFRMSGIVRGYGSVFSTLPEWMNGHGSLLNTGDGGATSKHQRNNVIKRRVPTSVSKPSLFLRSRLQARATATVFCCILMCANQLKAGPSIHLRYCFSTAGARVLASAGTPRHVWENREAPREVTSKEKGTESVGGLSTLQLSSVVCSKVLSASAAEQSAPSPVYLFAGQRLRHLSTQVMMRFCCQSATESLLISGGL